MLRIDEYFFFKKTFCKIIKNKNFNKMLNPKKKNFLFNKENLIMKKECLNITFIE